MKNTFVKNKIVSATITLLALSSLQACSTSEQLAENAPIHSQSLTIKHNQIGYQLNANKEIAVPTIKSESFSVTDATGNVVLSGKSNPPAFYALSGESVSIVDLSSISKSGTYTLSLADSNRTITFEVAQNPYEELHKAAIKAYYYNRASIEITPELGGKFAREAGHPDTNVKIHASAADKLRPEGTVVSSPKGWYDAGDYNKYIVNSGISVYTLLLALQHYDEYYGSLALEIPEANNELPDLLDEIAWNVDWMSTMQDPNDGGVYHKLTTLNFSGIINPNEGDAQRYMVQKSTAAALNFAAVMAKSSVVYKQYDEALANKYLEQALAAFKWASDNPGAVYVQPEDVSTGEYGDDFLIDEFAWASAELYIATKDKTFLNSFNKMNVTPTVPNWADSSALGYITLLTDETGVVSKSEKDAVRATYLTLADTVLAQHNASAYKNAMIESDFVWGSNGVAMNNALVLFQAYRLTGDAQYHRAGEGLVNYVLGTNPTGYSYVTGHGKFAAKYPHHRPSEADDVVDAVPGFLVGGPHSGQQDGCDYVSSLPAQSYVDHWCSYASNEVTINWNAPFVYALAHLQNTTVKD